MRFQFRRSAAFHLRRARRWTGVAWGQLRRFPWRNTARTLRERFREDRLGVTAGSLTFTTTISLVPLFTVVLAVFSLFPTFGRLEGQLQQWLVQSLMPEGITRQVSRYLVQFANKAGQIGWTGAVVLLVTALALVLTIDRKLNDIWRVRKPRPLPQRVLVYWAVLTLGPLLLALSLSLTSYAASVSRGWATALPGGVQTLFDALEFVLSVCGVAALYRYVPHAQVRWSHALVGGLFVSLGWEAGRKLLAWYLAKVPTYSMVYGAFATLPILLTWIYLAWVIVLLGAVVVAYLPSLVRGVARRGDGPGWDFQLALEVLALLQAQRVRSRAGWTLDALARRLAVDPLQLEAPLGALVALEWVGRLDEPQARYVLVVDPERVALSPLVARLLLAQNPSTQAVWMGSRWDGQPLAAALPHP
jgi:membrane protein